MSQQNLPELNTCYVDDLKIPDFDERKTVQVAALLVKRFNNKLDRDKLLKMIYLIDRKSLEARGYPVTFDHPYNMKFGPILSHTYRLMKEGNGKYWNKVFLVPDTKHLVKLRDVEVGIGALSEADMEYIDKVIEEVGHLSFHELSQYTHKLEEYEDTGDTSRPIEWNNWLRAVGWDDDEILDIREELDARASFEKMVGDAWE